jgi:hypothetical protein
METRVTRPARGVRKQTAIDTFSPNILPDRHAGGKTQAFFPHRTASALSVSRDLYLFHALGAKGLC